MRDLEATAISRIAWINAVPDSESLPVALEVVVQRCDDLEEVSGIRVS
jgi:hypothetical protein